MCAVADWPNESFNELGAITAISIQENDDLALGWKGANTSCTRTAVTAPRFQNYFRASLTRARTGSIIAAIIDDDDFARNFRRDTFAHDVRDRFLFVQRGND
jgi:hypothetical protein